MEKRERPSKLILAFFLLFLTWNFLIFASPFFLPSGSVQDISGLSMVNDNSFLDSDIDLPWSSVYSVGDHLCHQKSSRSFFLNGNQMPFCARCVSIWMGLLIGVGFMFFYRIVLDEKFVFILLAGFLPMVFDGFGQLFGFWESTNMIRVFTGLLVGILCGISTGVIVDEASSFFDKSEK
ncbi:MAG: DUF2085 domain-containing protein [Candidatus Thermoplasmatota archaeon]